jgi:hypothetical protein
MTTLRTIMGTALVAGALMAGSGVASAAVPAAAASSEAAAVPSGPCTKGVHTVVEWTTIYARGTGGCSSGRTTFTVELRQSRGSGWATVARGSCVAPRLGTCTAFTPRVVYSPGYSWSTVSSLS